MLKTFTFTAALLATAPALACDQAQLRALKDQVKALEAQARSLERLERERNKMIDRDIRSRS